MNIEELEDMYNDFIITNGQDYWKYIILEHLINNFEEKNINQGFKENCCCDNFGYCCGASCKYYANCKM